MKFRLSISTPDKVFFDDEVDAIVCPGLGGKFGVLARHLPLVAGLDVGIIKVRNDSTATLFVVDGGLAEVRGASVNVCANAVVVARDPADAEEKMEELRVTRYHPTNLG